MIVVGYDTGIKNFALVLQDIDTCTIHTLEYNTALTITSPLSAVCSFSSVVREALVNIAPIESMQFYIDGTYNHYRARKGQNERLWYLTGCITQGCNSCNVVEPRQVRQEYGLSGKADKAAVWYAAMLPEEMLDASSHIKDAYVLMEYGVRNV